MKTFNLSGIIIIVGNYGSGKTEVAINLAADQRARGREVRIADLDLVNPYFRTREARKVLTEMGIDVVLPPAEYMQADLPVLTPAVSGMIRQPAEVTILDAGGNEAGATVLSALADFFKGMPFHMLQVINPFRPYTDSVEGCRKIRKEIVKASRLTVTGLIGNPNLIGETTAADIEHGYEFIKTIGMESGLNPELLTIPAPLIKEMDLTRFACPVLPIRRQLTPPWKKAADIKK